MGRARGSLVLMTGPMCSGKTSRLVLHHRMLKGILATHVLDVRNELGIKTHGGNVWPARKVTRLNEIHASCGEHVFLDEGQFMDPEHLLEDVRAMIDAGVHVHIAGLDMSSERVEYPYIAMLTGLPQTKREFFYAECVQCRKDAAFTRCNVVKDDVLLVDPGDNTYEPVCAEHWRPTPVSGVVYPGVRVQEGRREEERAERDGGDGTERETE